MAKLISYKEYIAKSDNAKFLYLKELLEQHCEEVGFPYAQKVNYRRRLVLMIGGPVVNKEQGVDGFYVPEPGRVIIVARDFKVRPEAILSALAHELGHWLHHKELGKPWKKLSYGVKERAAWLKGLPLAKKWGVFEEYREAYHLNLEDLRVTLRSKEIEEGWVSLYKRDLEEIEAVWELLN